MLRQTVRGILLHPLVGRLGYDALVLLLSYGLVELVVAFTGTEPVHWHEWLIFAGGVLGVNYLLGLYTNFKTSPPLTKTFLLAVAVLAVVMLMSLMLIPGWQLVLAGLTALGLMSLPRWFLNINREAKFSVESYQLVHDNDPVLVVGGAGYIGSHVVEQLLDKGEKVRVFDTFYYNSQVFDDIASNKLELAQGDITDLFALTRAMTNVKAIVHLAGIVGDPAASLDDELTRHLNIVTTRMVKEQAKALGISRFIFASSCSVYGAAEDRVNENSRLNPVSLYAQTKIDSEKEILEEVHDLFHPTVLRFATVFGHSRRMRFDLVANLFTAQAYHNGLITVKGSGQWRPMVHVSDIARAIILALEAPLPKVSRQIFNVGDDKLNTTIGQMGELAQKVVKKSRLGKAVEVSVDDSSEDRRNYHVSFEKINKALGFKAETDLKMGMTEIYRHLKAGDYKKAYTDPNYSNLEMTKLIQKEFHSDEYRKTHFSLLAK